MFLVFITMLCYWGYAYYQSKKIAKDISNKQQAILKLRNDILNSEGRKELLIRQGQLTEATKLLGAHPYWSKFLPELGQVTLKAASYLSISATNAGTLRLSAVAADYNQVDKFLQVFDTNDFNKYFSDVRLFTLSKYQLADTSGIKFDIEMKYDASILKNSNP